MISIILPTYNEKDNIETIVKSILRILKKEKIKIIIVDDSSPDGTGEIAEKLKKKYKSKIVVIHRKEKGRGTAGIRGFKEALKLKSEYILEMDADLSHDPRDLPRFLDEIKKTDIVVGSRFVGWGGIQERSFFRNFLSSLASFSIRLILGMKVKDIQSGYKCYSRDVMKKMKFSKFISTGYSIGVETLYRSHKNNFKIKEIPIIFRNRTKGKSKFNSNEMVGFISTAFKLRSEKSV